MGQDGRYYAVTTKEDGYSIKKPTGAVLMFQKQPGGAKKLTVGISWAIITALYLILTVRTGAWYATWLLFPMGAALGGVINGIFEL